MSLLYFIGWALIYVLFGSTLYIIDSRKGRRLYRWGYAMTHKDPLPAEMELSFIYCQPTRRRFWAALVLSTILALLIRHGTGDGSLLAGASFWFFGIPLIMIGFILGPQIGKLWWKKDKMFEAIDRKIAGGTDPASTSSGETGGDKIHAGGTDLLADEPSVTTTTSEAPATTEPKPEDDPRAAIDRFTSGR